MPSSSDELKKLPPPITQNLPIFADKKKKRLLTLIDIPVPTRKKKYPQVMWLAGLFFLVASVLVLAIPHYRHQHFSKKPHYNHDKNSNNQHINAQALFVKGVHAFEAKNYQEAINAFKQTIALEPTLVEAHRSLGIAYATTHQEAKAMAEYQIYLQQKPEAEDAAALKKILHDYQQAHLPTTLRQQ